MLTVQTLADELEITPAAVRQWVRRGAPYTTKNGAKLFDLTKIRAWMEKHNLSGKPGRQREPLNRKTKEERLRLLKAKADRAELELRRMQTELVPVAEVEKASIRKILTVKGALLGLPPAIAPQLAGLGVPEIQQRLEQEMTRICEEFARK